MGLEYFERVRENLDTIEGRSRINQLVAEEIGRQAIADPIFMERAKARFLGELSQQQENVEAVALAAQAKIEVTEDAEVDTAEPTAEPTQDWMNTFTREAEGASSEELRERLAQVLAGEARKPGTYSRSTVRLIAELEKEVLEGFQELLTHRVGDAIVRGDDWGSGRWFMLARELESEGFVTGSEGFTHRKIRINEAGNGFLIGQNLSLTIKGKPETEHQLSILLLTRVGKEVASLLKQTDEIASLQRAASILNGKDGFDQIWLGGHKDQGSGQYFVTQALLLWDREQETFEEPAS